ncbi:MAG: glycosyltransferase, partial [Planctomycetota bacterium]
RAQEGRSKRQRRSAQRHANTPNDAMIDVIVPVYRGLEELRACVDSVIASGGLGSIFELVLVDDRGPDADVEGYLRELSERGPRGVHVLRNDRNLGFVASVNNGMRLHPGRDVILLNSDTETPAGWVQRLIACARSRPEIATVSPFSNNATICSWPRFCEDNDLPEASGLHEIDDAFRQANSGRHVEVPTTVGYCMYIKRAAIEDAGLFDEQTFGRGYGEENDFCMRTRRNGWTHALCADTFVYHKGKVSFGSTSNPRIDEAQRTLARLHPHYQPIVARHVRDDPARTLRLRASAALLARSGRPAVLAIGHTSGGGTQRHIDELASWVADRTNTVALRGTGEHHVAVSLSSRNDADSVLFDLERDWDELIELLNRIGVRRIHVHHTMGLPARAWALPEALGVPVDFTAHDYYGINANPTLTDAEARYCGDAPDRDALCVRRYPIPGGAPATVWRANHQRLLQSCDRVFAPSRAASEIIEGAFDDVRITVADHPDREAFGPYPEPRARALDVREPLRVAVIGAMSKDKGADVLEAAADAAVRRQTPVEFTLVGYAYRPLSPVIHATGPYNDAELPALLGEHRPHIVWFPAQWPETYNYVLSRVLELGLPVAVPQIGSFPERVAGRPLSWVMPWDSPPVGWVTLFDNDVRRGLIASAPPRAPGVPDAYRRPAHAFRYAGSYVPAGLGPGTEVSWARAAELVSRRRKRRLTPREVAALTLAELKNGRYTRKVAGLVPEHVQKSVKARLTSRSSTDLMAARSRG